MALFSRRKNAAADAAAPTDITAESAVDEVVEAVAAERSAPAEAVPNVSISVSPFGGLGVSPEAARAQQTPAPSAPAGTVPVSALDNHNPDGSVKLPFAPDEPPTEWSSAAGLRDNAVLRDALGRLPEDPTTPQLLGVVRQVQGGVVGHGLNAQDLADAHHRVEGGTADTVVQGAVDGGQRYIHREGELPHAPILPCDLVSNQLCKIIHIRTSLFCKEFPIAMQRV